MRVVKPLIVGLVGFPGAGKTTVAKFFENNGFTRITLSDFIKEDAKRVGIRKFSRNFLQDYGNKMRQTFGPQILAQLALKKIHQNQANKAVIDGIRNLYEVAFLEAENKFFLLGVVASPKIRFERLIIRKGKRTDTYKDFIKQEHREESLGAKEIGLRVKACLKRVSYRIKNEGALNSLETEINRLIQKISHSLT